MAQFADDRAAVLARAAEAGVGVIVNPGIDLPSSQRAIELAAAHPAVYAMVGIHPYDAAAVDDETSARLRALARQPKVVAIGEIGLDYYRGPAPREVQMAAFRRLLDLAAELGQPVVIHQREAAADVAAILSEWVAGLRPDPYAGRWRGVLHAFAGDAALAGQALAWRFLVGLGGPLTFRNARQMHDTGRALPLQQVIIETDAPYLSPHPYRGQRNEPARVALVAAALAALQGVTVAEVARQTTENASRLFGIEP